MYIIYTHILCVYIIYIYMCTQTLYVDAYAYILRACMFTHTVLKNIRR